jgi:hypothetical protein
MKRKNMIRKKLIGHTSKAVFLFLGVFWLLSNANSVFGSLIQFKVAGEKKDVYALNDVINLTVSVEYTHKECTIGIDSTKLVVTGLEIVEPSPWKEINARKHEKAMKLKVLGTKDRKLTLKVVRECEFGGATGSITFKSAPAK